MTGYILVTFCITGYTVPMRAIINISLPKPMAVFIDTEVKSLNFASRSEFIRSLVREWQNKQIVKEVEKSKEASNKGNYKILTSLSDLG